MGAWSHEPFGNDTANDWAYGLEDAQDLSLIEAAFDAVNSNDGEYLDASVAEEAVAAAETLAHLLGRGAQMDSYTEKVQRWAKSVSARPNPALKNKARQALQRVLADGSELRELWEETEEYPEWQNSITTLQVAIGA
jgi:hypothetical protein